MPITDSKGRIIDYARISVTDRCNYRCTYCMPEEGVLPCSHADIMRFEDIIWMSGILASMGVRRVRFTGGEPFVRKGMPEFLASFSRQFPGISVFVTTNASLLSKHARAIEEARLSGLNISLDTIDPAKFAAITRTGSLPDVIAGIDAATRLGIDEIKTNTVLIRGFNDQELPEILNFSWSRGIVPRIIEFMPLEERLWGRDKFVSANEIFGILQRYGDWAPAGGPKKPSSGPAKYFEDRSTGRIVGLIEAVSRHFCSECNRLRITASGHMRACLFNNDEIPLLHLVRERDGESLIRAILSGIDMKPGNWREAADGFGRMSGIGG
jgi:cyclic pyranopterin phosphate synthase